MGPSEQPHCNMPIEFMGLVTILFKQSNHKRSNVQGALSKDNSSYLIKVVVSLGENNTFV